MGPPLNHVLGAWIAFTRTSAPGEYAAPAGEQSAGYERLEVPVDGAIVE